METLKRIKRLLSPAKTPLEQAWLVGADGLRIIAREWFDHKVEIEAAYIHKNGVGRVDEKFRKLFKWYAYLESLFAKGEVETARWQIIAALEGRALQMCGYQKNCQQTVIGSRLCLDCRKVLTAQVKEDTEKNLACDAHVFRHLASQHYERERGLASRDSFMEEELEQSYNHILLMVEAQDMVRAKSSFEELIALKKDVPRDVAYLDTPDFRAYAKLYFDTLEGYVTHYNGEESDRWRVWIFNATRTNLGHAKSLIETLDSRVCGQTVSNWEGLKQERIETLFWAVEEEPVRASLLDERNLEDFIGFALYVLGDESERLHNASALHYIERAEASETTEMKRIFLELAFARKRSKSVTAGSVFWNEDESLYFDSEYLGVWPEEEPF